jgi:hypothetical protein
LCRHVVFGGNVPVEADGANERDSQEGVENKRGGLVERVDEDGEENEDLDLGSHEPSPVEAALSVCLVLREEVDGESEDRPPVLVALLEALLVDEPYGSLSDEGHH